MAVEKGLLMHWWNYYGSIYTLAEMEEFERIIDKYGTDKVIEAGVASYLMGDGSPEVILCSIRKNKVEELFATLPDPAKMEDEKKEAYSKIKEVFIEAISEEYK